MTRRTRRIVQGAAGTVIVASLVVARVLSIESDRVGMLGVAQAGLFVAFAVAALTLFAMVVMDFDRWVDTVPPVPKRTVRRWAGRNARRISRVFALLLAWYGALMSWFWSTIGEALGWVLRRPATGLSLFWVSMVGASAWMLARYRAGAGWLWSSVGRGFVWVLARVGEVLTWLWVWAVRAGAWVLVRYPAGAGWLWSSSGRGFVWLLARVGEVLTWLWVWAVRAGAWVLVRYRAGAGWLWSSSGRGFVWLLARVGEGVTWLWVGLVRAAGCLWVGFRAGMRLLWVSVGRGFAWTLGAAGAGLAALWVWVTRAGAWLLTRCGAGIRWTWRSTLGRERVASTSPRRRWYSTAVESALGIPPEGTPFVDAIPARRASRRPRPANRPRPTRRPSFRDDAETDSSRTATRTTAGSALTPDPRARYVGRQVTRRGERRKSEELLDAALARFRSARSESRDREKDRDDR